MRIIVLDIMELPRMHGPNSVISMVDHYLTKHSIGEKKAHFHCDNCVGQNYMSLATWYGVLSRVNIKK